MARETAETPGVASESPEFADLPNGMAVARRAVLHPSGIAQQCGVTYPMLGSHLKKSGAEPGRLYSIYFFFTPLLTRMENGIFYTPSSPDKTVPTDPAHGIIVVNHPEVKAAAMWHIGPYQKLGDTYKALCAWIRAQGKYPGSLMFEEYYTNPMEEKDPAKYKTRVYMSFSDSFLGSMGECSIM
ncbi:hypothetical protein CLOP_g12868 [Closterium sp. NIES-67]|nr:hypothetical protein CLOP_g12868 [Closterium sp. NIES-67]